MKVIMDNRGSKLLKSRLVEKPGRGERTPLGQAPRSMIKLYNSPWRETIWGSGSFWSGTKR